MLTVCSDHLSLSKLAIRAGFAHRTPPEMLDQLPMIDLLCDHLTSTKKINRVRFFILQSATFSAMKEACQVQYTVRTERTETGHPKS